MKIFIKVALLLFCLIGVSALNVQAEPYGPEIKGFQLGMSEADVQKLIESYGCRYTGGSLIFNKEHEVMFNVIFKDGVLTTFSIIEAGISRLFNATGSRKGFLQAFVDHYNIPEMEAYGRDGGVEYYEYKDIKDGYKIVCTTNAQTEVSSISIVAIPKETGNFTF